jgi:hypothetical protein
MMDSDVTVNIQVMKDALGSNDEVQCLKILC